ncbi:vacuolar iron transporter homolog 1-like [Vicia villosa]|uniref:vacuolar iron transporter homolog 1-like n=1 Tax=Vicia villosa TaxID=3911 RepID=UPI00273BC563|nr:vacuolar iron transporter homolog 1-like [Vicia villosa]
MAVGTICDSESLNHVATNPNLPKEIDEKKIQVTENNNHNTDINYWQRAQWLRAAVLGANDGLVSVASLMMGVGAVKKDITAMLVAGFAGLVAGACGMGIGEFVSVYTQYEVEVGQMMREIGTSDRSEKKLENELEKRKSLPNPMQAASASAFSFSIGGLVPLLCGSFISDYKIRLIVMVAISSFALVVFGRVGAELGKTPKLKTSIRFLLGGWMAMAITFGLTKLLAHCSGLDLDI